MSTTENTSSLSTEGPTPEVQPTTAGTVAETAMTKEALDRQLKAVDLELKAAWEKGTRMQDEKEEDEQVQVLHDLGLQKKAIVQSMLERGFWPYETK
jgi:2-hydroxychromene-2-carboxylate isomerase